MRALCNVLLQMIPQGLHFLVTRKQRKTFGGQSQAFLQVAGTSQCDRLCVEALPLLRRCREEACFKRFVAQIFEE